jgi:eukaryotic-like serine/threonine-protein kinase
MKELSPELEERIRQRTNALTLSSTAVGVTLRAPPTSLTATAEAPLPRITLAPRGGAEAVDAAASTDLVTRAILGEGGMGRVHLAEQRSLARDVAVKTLKPDAPSSAARTLIREARVTGLLEHPGVIPVHALGIGADERPVLVMKRVEGMSLATRLDGRPQRGDALEEAVEILRRVCDTAGFAHSRGVVHRDIKPENVMVGAFGEVYLLDWGIATTLDAEVTELVGTPAYLAPEMVFGDRVDARTDVYLLGATLHEILTGRPRHEGDSLMVAVESAIESAPATFEPDVDPRLAELCNRATARDPDLRPASAAAFQAELLAWSRHRSAETLIAAAVERLREVELALETPDTPRDLPTVYRLLAEARFGLTQGLASSSDDPSGRAAMRRCLAASVELELRQDHLDAAAVHARELDPPDPELLARIEARRRDRRTAAAEQARLAEVARSLDPSRAARRRTMPLLAVWTVFTVIGVALSTVPAGASSRGLLVASTVGFAFVAIGFVIRRNSEGMRNAFNRRAAATILLGGAAVVVHRLFGFALGRPPHETLAGDLLLFAVLASTAAVTLFARLLWMLVPVAVGVVAVLAWPSYATATFTLSVSLMILAGAAVLPRQREP